MREVVSQAEARFGPIHGVFHAAMVMASASIEFKHLGLDVGEFGPKVNGTLVLDEVLGCRALDFMVLCSSISAITGGFGQVGYCAANLFLDAFAHERSRRGHPTVAIDWDRWRGVGHTEAAYSAWYEQVTGRRLEGGLSIDDALDALGRILGRGGAAQFAVSTAPIENLASASPDLEAEEVDAEAPRHPRPALDASFVPASSDTERRVSQVWCAVLNLAEVGADDSFTELGGDSLIGIQVASRIRDELSVDVSVRDLFEDLTVAVLAARIDRLRDGADGSPITIMVDGVL